MIKCFFAVLLLLPSSVMAGSSLCNPSEVDLFPCHGSKKMASLCASKNLSKTDGYVQYRYGTKRKIELIYPEKLEHPSSFFTYGEKSFAQGTNTFLRFKINQVTYMLYSEDGFTYKPTNPGNTKNYESSSLIIENNDKIISHYECKEFNPLGEFSELVPENKTGILLP